MCIFRAAGVVVVCPDLSLEVNMLRHYSYSEVVTHNLMQVRTLKWQQDWPCIFIGPRSFAEHPEASECVEYLRDRVFGLGIGLFACKMGVIIRYTRVTSPFQLNESSPLCYTLAFYLLYAMVVARYSWIQFWRLYRPKTGAFTSWFQSKQASKNAISTNMTFLNPISGVQ